MPSTASIGSITPGAPGDRIGDVDAVDEQRALRRARAGNADGAVRCAQHIRHQRQHIVVLTVRQHRAVDDVPRDDYRRIWRGVADHGGRWRRRDGEALLEGGERQLQVDDDGIGADDDLWPRRGDEPGELRGQRVAAGRRSNGVIAPFAGGRRQRRSGGAGERDENARQRQAVGVRDAALHRGGCGRQRRSRAHERGREPQMVDDGWAAHDGCSIMPYPRRFSAL